MILGHGHPAIIAAIERQARIGLSYGAPTELEVRMAELVCRMVPSIEMVRMVSSGTEATMSAIRVARAATGREIIIKFEGCYHGHGDAFLSKAGSGMATLGEPTSPGVPRGAAACTLNARYNDLASVEALFAAHPRGIAGVIVEPVVGNMGCVIPKEGFLEGLRSLCTREGAVLIFDEVMTGFRLAPGGAQELYGVRPDLTTLGKVIGGGLPVGAYGGKAELMRVVSPAGPMYQAGTLSGNPLAMAAGIAQLTHLSSHPEIYTDLDRRGAVIEEAVRAHASAKDYPIQVARVGSMGTVFFSEEPVVSWDIAAGCDTARFARWFWWLMERGVYLPCAQYEAFFFSHAHTDSDIARTAELMVEGLDAVFA
jgi:glutamate-1-semialdehyde 2,1-aminomutase